MRVFWPLKANNAQRKQKRGMRPSFTDFFYLSIDEEYFVSNARPSAPPPNPDLCRPVFPCASMGQTRAAQ